MGFERVVLPVLEIARHCRGVVERNHQASAFQADRDRSVPRIVVDSGVELYLVLPSKNRDG